MQTFRTLGFYRVNEKAGSKKIVGSASDINKDFDIFIDLATRYGANIQIESLRKLFVSATWICDKDVRGNFVQYSAFRNLSTLILAIVLKKYSTKPRLLYRVDIDHNSAINHENNNLSAEIFRELTDLFEVADIVVTTDELVASATRRNPFLLGMISFLDLEGCQKHDQEFHRIASQLVDGAHVHPVATFNNIKTYNHPSQIDILPDDETLSAFVRKRYKTNPIILPEEVNQFKKIEMSRESIISQMSQNERFQIFQVVSEVAQKLVKDGNGVFRFIEVGSFAGASLFVIYQTIRLFPLTVQGYVVEPYGQETLFQLVDEYGPEIELLSMMSYQAAPTLFNKLEEKSQRASLILIDANHSYKAVREDIENFLPLLDTGGVMLLHDYLPALNAQNHSAIMVQHAGKEPGVRLACEELLDNHPSMELVDIPVLYPQDLTQSQPHLPIIPLVKSTIRAYKKIP